MFFKKKLFIFFFVMIIMNALHGMQEDKKCSFREKLHSFGLEEMQNKFNISLIYKQSAGHFGVILRCAEEFLHEQFLKDRELVTTVLLNQYQNEFISYIEDEINKGMLGSFYGSTIELFKLACSSYWLMYKKIIEPSDKKLFIDQKVFDEKLLPLFIMAECKPPSELQTLRYKNSLLFALAFNPKTINKLVYEYDFFGKLYMINSKNGQTLGNAKKKFFNFFVSAQNKKPLKVTSVFKDFIAESKFIGAYMMNEVVYVPLDIGEQKNKVRQTRESNIEYFKHCFKPTSYLKQQEIGKYFKEMTKSSQKGFITFLMCNKRQAWRKMPNTLVRQSILPRIHTYDLAQRMKPFFIEDIKRCKESKDIPSDEYSQSLINFLYNDFEQWYNNCS